VANATEIARPIPFVAAVISAFFILLFILWFVITLQM